MKQLIKEITQTEISAQQEDEARTLVLLGNPASSAVVMPSSADLKLLDARDVKLHNEGNRCTEDSNIKPTLKHYKMEIQTCAKLVGELLRPKNGANKSMLDWPKEKT
eukprot:12510216-Ditylum_brightwellii.AAC.1